MKEVKVSIGELSLDPANARKHSEVDIRAIAESLTQFGQQTPVVIDAQGIIIKGNGTYMAALSLGWKTIVTTTTDLEGSSLRAYAIADNQTGLLSQWDETVLAEQIAGMDSALKEALQLNANPNPPESTPSDSEPKPDTKAVKVKKHSIRIENVTQDDKNALVELLMDVVKECDLAYSATAY